MNIHDTVKQNKLYIGMKLTYDYIPCTTVSNEDICDEPSGADELHEQSEGDMWLQSDVALLDGDIVQLKDLGNVNDPAQFDDSVQLDDDVQLDDGVQLDDDVQLDDNEQLDDDVSFIMLHSLIMMMCS